jgi:thiol-disulfide isomerase/thioredoxin
MQIKYIASMAAIAILSTVTLFACTTPDANNNQASSSTTTTATKADPCAAKDKANPCAAKDKANPCAAKDKANPYAMNAADSIGAPLAQKLQGKPVVVDIYASWCAACKNIAPTVAELKKEYEGKVEFVVLDVSDKSTTATAEATAQELGLSKFLAENKTQTGSLTIVEPSTGKILAQYRNNPDKSAYSKVLDAAITK